MKKNTGFTLVEIMMAVAILAFIVLPIFGLLNYANRGTREQDAEGIAANLAKETMNQLMFVASSTNLLAGAGSPQPLPQDHTIKGNFFTGEYVVKTYTSDEITFSVPQTEFHDPMDCAAGNGLETKSAATIYAAGAEPMTLSDLYPEHAGEVMMADIHLKIRWKLPSQASFDPRNELELVARRTFLVTN
jgi:prepilin-type N-terminal cleavage/methylation domain-containing protein